MSALLIFCVSLANIFVSSEDDQLKVTTASALHNKHNQGGAPTAAAFAPTDLPAYSASVLVKTFTDIADDVHVPVDEVVYTSDKLSSKPYRRYRMAVTTKAGYSELRNFIAVLDNDMPYVVLDSVHCTRADVADNVLGCELTFSAYFQQESHG